MRVKTLARRLGSVALVATLGITLAACGDDTKGDGDSSSSSSSKDGDGGAEDEGGESTAELTELSADEFYPTIMEAMKEAETLTLTSTSTSTGSGGTQETVAETRYGSDSVDMKATVTSTLDVGSGEKTTEEQMILLGRVLYLTDETVAPDGKWLKVDLDDEDNPMAKFLNMSLDPEVMMGVKYPPKHVELLGQEEIDGIETNHYRVTVDPTQAFKDMDLEGLEEFLPEEIEMEMWVDADNLPRKFFQKTRVASPAGGADIVTETEGLYSDYGADIEIEAPADDEISDEDPFGM